MGVWNSCVSSQDAQPTHIENGTLVEKYQLNNDWEGWHIIGGLLVKAEVIASSGDVYDSLHHWVPRR